MPLFDLHNHLDATDDPVAFASQLHSLGVVGALSCTVTPADYERAQALSAAAVGVRVALGLHPWWVADGRADERTLAQFIALAPSAPYIGEIGVDRTARVGDTIERQQRFLTECVRASRPTARLYSFHSSHAAAVLLDLLEEHGGRMGAVE